MRDPSHAAQSDSPSPPAGERGPGGEGSPLARPPLALSTMWAMQPRFQHDLRAFLERTAELGYDAVEINHSMDAQMAGAILAARDVLPVASVHAPAPLERHATAGWNRELNLAATDEAERTLAVDYVRRTIALAAEAGASRVVVHLGHIARAPSSPVQPYDGERRVRAAWPRRDDDPAAWRDAIATAQRDRTAAAAPHLEAATRTLAALAFEAETRGITLGLETRLHYHELPLPHEAAALLVPYPAHVAGYWHDVGHAEVQHRLGLTSRDAWFDTLGARLVGVHLHDVAALTDHRAPGNAVPSGQPGGVDFAWLAARIPPHVPRTLEIDQHEPDAAVAAAIGVLRAAGLA